MKARDQVKREPWWTQIVETSGKAWPLKETEIRYGRESRSKRDGKAVS